MKIDTHEAEYLGYKIRIEIHHDEYMGPPWKEHDGHGDVSDWTRRDKRPGERTLCTDGGFSRFYDWQGAIKKAKAEGWGIDDERCKALARKLGRTPTQGDIFDAAVQFDFDYLKGWANDEWHWLGYTTEIKSHDGALTDGNSCWGFDDRVYMLDEAEDNARLQIDAMIATERETEIAACIP